MLLRLSRWPIMQKNNETNADAVQRKQVIKERQKAYLPKAKPNTTTLISVARRKNRTEIHRILSAYSPLTVAALTVIDTQHLMTLIIMFAMT